jgi:acetyl esterase/lipase
MINKNTAAVQGQFLAIVHVFFLSLILFATGCASPQLLPTAPIAALPVITDQPYKTGDHLTDYERLRCTLDLYRPATGDFPTVVWFYGGALTAGDKSNSGTVGIARALVRNGIGCAVVNYRLYPKAKFPAYLDDAAAATAWTFHHISKYGGDPSKIFVGGHSAGGYLSADIGFDPSYLKNYDISTDQIAGLLPVSPQVFTHFTIRRERGIANPEMTPVIDDAAPAYHIRADAPPTLILIGDHDWAGRLEECQYFVTMARIVHDRDIRLQVIPHRTHGSIADGLAQPNDPGMNAMLAFVQSHISRP